MPLFCRHNRLEANCPICSREKASPGRSGSSSRGGRGGSSGPARRPGSPQPARHHGTGHRAGRLVTKRLARATDDGYRHELIPGVRATADAERLAHALADAADRLEYPGPYPEVAEVGDIETATWLAFLLALAGPDRPELQAAILTARPPFEGDGESGLGAEAERTIAAYRTWVERHGGSQEVAIAGDNAWSATRRFARTFDRLALPGFGRAERFEFLVTLGAAAVQEVEADALHVAVAHDDPTTLGAKRALSSGDAMLLERRAAALAHGTGVPIAALDRALALWDRTTPLDSPAGERVEGIRAALKLG